MIFHGLQFSKQLLCIFLPPKSTWARCYLCRQELFALLLLEMNILEPGLGQGVTNQIKFSSSFSTLLMGRFMFIIHMTASQYLIALCCLIPKKHRHFFCCCCKRTLPVREGGKHKNIRCLSANITSSERFQGLGLFLKESVENKREGEKSYKRNQ